MKVLLRKATSQEADAMTFFQARNDPVARRFSRNAEPIRYDEHVRWYADAIRDPDRRLFVIECDGERAGYCRVEGSKNEVSIAILPSYRGKHVASEALKIVSEMFARETLVAVIKNDNAASKSLFERAGFLRTGARGDWETWERA